MEKKEGKNYVILKIFESLILIALIGSVLMIVLETFFDQMNEGYETYEYKDYSYDSYDEYYSDLDYYNTEDNSISNFVTIEDFLNSETGKEFLKKSDQNLANTNEIEMQNVVENEVEDSTNDSIPDAEDLYNYYDEQKAMKEKFEEQKKKIEIKDEGKSSNKEIMVSIKNNDKDFLYDIVLNTIFFKDNKIIFIDVQEINVIDGNKTKYIKVSSIPEEYDSYEFLISKKYYMEYYNEFLNDDVKFNSYVNGDAVRIEVQNKSSKKIDRIHFTILYFDNKGNLINFEEVQEYSIKAKKSSTLIGYGIWDEDNGDYLKFSDYRVMLDYAENYGY